jgi:UDP-glucose 4-epimerase
MRILVTGGAGFIGSHVVSALAERQHELLVVDNYATGRRDAFADAPGEVTVVNGSIADEDVLADAFATSRPELVIHCAASYKDPDDWEEDLRTNALGSARVVKASAAASVGRLIYFQTALCYGNRPLEQPISLAHALAPESSYAISKTAGEQYIALSGLDFVSLRLANVYGPGNLSGPVPTFYKRLTAGEKCIAVNTRRDFVYVKDLVDVVLRAVDGRGERGYYHVSSGSDYAIKDLYDAVAAALGVTEPVEERERGPDDAPTILLDPAKTERDFSWHASTPLTEGIAETVAWYESHGVGETYTHLRMRT